MGEPAEAVPDGVEDERAASHGMCGDRGGIALAVEYVEGSGCHEGVKVGAHVVGEVCGEAVGIEERELVVGVVEAEVVAFGEWV